MRKVALFFWSGISGMILLAALMLSIAPVAAQEPTPTPTDPIWLAFSAARDAIAKERSVNLSIIRNYTFEQQEYVKGIDDGCRTLPEGEFSRRVWFGWTFNITDLQGTTYQARVSFDLKDVAVCDKVVTSEPAEAPADTGNLPAPVAGSAATGGFELGGQVLQLNSNTISLLHRAKMTWAITLPRRRV